MATNRLNNLRDHSHIMSSENCLFWTTTTPRPPLILTPISSLNFITCYHLRTPSPLTEVINMWIICKVKDNEYLCIILHILAKKIRASFRNNFYVIPQRLVFNTVVDTNNIFSKNVYFILKNITWQYFWMVS